MPLITLVYYWFNWVVINYIISSREVNDNIRKIIRLFIIVGTIVSVYNFYALIFVKIFGFPDLIPEFLDFRNSTTGKKGRFGGFSDEPGTYVYLQTWIVYYLILSDIVIKHRKFITVINILSWIFTISSMLVPGVIILLCAVAYKNKKLGKKIFLSVAILFVFVFFYIENDSTLQQIQYFAFEKIKNYIVGGDNTLDSGAMRSFSTRLGIRLFLDNMILGSGPGTDNFFIWKYEYQMGIITWGERITALSSPQNSYARVIGELGIFGFLSLICFFAFTIIRQKNYIRKAPFMLASLCGTIFCAFSLITIYPICSLYIWINIAFSLNIIRFYKCTSIRTI